jgi:hypothetical protein
VRARQANDNLCFARLREESDTMANKAKEDRVVITGITSKSAPPTDPEQRKTWIKKIASDIFESLIPDFQGQIHFVNQARNKGTHIPLIEVKLFFFFFLKGWSRHWTLFNVFGQLFQIQFKCFLQYRVSFNTC